MLCTGVTLVEYKQLCFGTVNSIHWEIKVLTHRRGHQVQTVIQVVGSGDLLSTRNCLLTSCGGERLKHSVDWETKQTLCSRSSLYRAQTSKGFSYESAGKTLKYLVFILVWSRLRHGGSKKLLAWWRRRQVVSSINDFLGLFFCRVTSWHLILLYLLVCVWLGWLLLKIG